MPTATLRDAPLAEGVVEPAEAAVTETEAPPDREALLARCSHIAEADDLLALFVADLRDCGFAGDTRNAEVLYLALTSRLFEKPASVVLKGSSSAGKSFTLNMVLRFFPERIYELRTGMSEKAILHMEKDMRHRFLVVQEFSGLQSPEGNWLIRQMLSEGQIDYGTVQMDRDNQRSGKELHVAGPMGLAMTTTRESLHWEDENRCLALRVDDSAEQTALILATKGHRYAGGFVEAGDREDWQAFHDWVSLGSHRVLVPYAPALSGLVDPSEPSVARDYDKLMALVQAHALIHQLHRERSAEGAVIASLQDYAKVHSLVAEVIGEGLAANVPATVRETVNAVWQVVSTGRMPVSNSDLVEVLSLHPSTISRRVEKCIELGYLTNREPNSGRASQLEVLRELPEDRPIFPSLEQLLETVRTRTSD